MRSDLTSTLRLPLLAALFLCTPIAPAALKPSGGAGPENHRLRLKLTISTARRDGIDTHAVRLDLFNVGKQSVTLVGKWPYEHLPADYAEFLKSEVAFLTFPEVHPSGAQTAGAMRTSPQPRCEIKSGETLSVTWTAHGPRLKPEDVFDRANTTPHFPSDGLYGVRAQFTAITATGERILLTSNDQPVPIGGSTHMPKYATAHIIAADPANKTARINLGSDHGLEKGDVFFTRYSLAAGWRLTLTQVDPASAEGTVEQTHHTGGPGIPAFPKESWLATLEPDRGRSAAR